MKNIHNTNVILQGFFKFAIIILMGIIAPTTLLAVDQGLYLQGEDGRTIHIVDLDTGRYIKSYEVQKGSASFFQPTPGGSAVFVVSANNTVIEAFLTDTGELYEVFEENWTDIIGISFTPNGDRLFVLDRIAPSTGRLHMYNHSRIHLEYARSIDFPISQSGDIVFNSRGTRYFALGKESGKEVLISGDATNGRILDSFELGFAGEVLRITANDRFAWVASGTKIAVIDLRRGKIIRSISGNFNVHSLVLELGGKRAFILSALGSSVSASTNSGTKIYAYNVQNGKLFSEFELRSNYSNLLLDSNSQPILIPPRTNEVFKTFNLKVNRIIDSEELSYNLASLASTGIQGSNISWLKTGGNFACF